jgi:type I restriction-modification system DNA methylase subunit
MHRLPNEEESAKAVWKCLQPIMAKGHSPDKVFHDWLDLMIYAFQCRDPEYLQIMARYNNDGKTGERPADYFANALAELMRQMQQNCTDVLGQIYTDEITRGENGQFFTPTHVCELMARLNCPDVTQEPLRYADPACGSGRTLIAVQKRVPNGWYLATDIDARCCKMTALNMLFRNASGIVVHGNSLSLETWRAWETKRTMLGGALREMPEEEMGVVKTLLEAQFEQGEPQRIPDTLIKGNGQMVLL